MRTDGRINIAIDVDGKEVEQGRRSVQGLEDDARKVKGGADQASGGIKNISASLALVKIGAAAFSVLANSMDSAISRFDTFQGFPDVMSALGESTEDSEQAINKLSNGIEGLPTKLDDIVTTTQRMYATFKDLDESTDTALALNNALLASGASADDAQRGTEQYIRSLQKGKFEMEEWKTLQETMTIGLSVIAESFGMTERELKSALDSGQISMEQFNDRMIELGTGTGRLAELAKVNSESIETALTNLRNTATRGLADIIEAFSDMVEEVSGRSLYDNLESLKNVINSAFKAISSTIRALAPVITTMVKAFQGLLKVANALSPVILGLASAYAALLIINEVKSAVESSRKAFDLMSGTIQKITVLTQSKTAAELANTSVQAKYLAANLASLKSLTAKNIVLGLLTGQLKFATAATLLKAKAVTVLNGVMTALSGPIGLVVAGIGLLVAGGVALVKWLNRSTEEGERLARQTDTLSESTNELTGEIDSNARGYEKHIRRTEASAAANADLAKKIGELSSQENLNSQQKKELQENIELLNSEVEGLNIAYDEEAKALSMSSEEMQKRIELMAEEEKYNAAKERQLEISKEQHEVDMQLKDVVALREHYHEQLDEGAITKKEYKESTAELDEQEKALNETLEILAVQYGVTEEAMREAMENQHAIAKTTTGEQIILYEGLSDSLQQTVDDMAASYQSLQEAATNAFEKIETDTDHTMASMIETMRHNQEAVAEWGENQAQILEWAGANGYDNLVPYVESMGIDSAAELAVLANASEEEMVAFANALEEGGDVGTTAFAKSIGEGGAEAVEAVHHLIDDTGEALSTRIREADFPSMGGDVASGLADGVNNNADKAIDASGNMADDMTRKTKQTLLINSPSGVYKDIGKNVTEGLALGIKEGTNNAVQAINDLFDQISVDTTNSMNNITKDISQGVKELDRTLNELPKIADRAMSGMLRSFQAGGTRSVSFMSSLQRNLRNQFSSTPRQFQTIGQQAMNGLVWGLNSGRGRVMSTARSIANSVRSTMQSALRIKSPSGVMRDDVGRWIPEGLAKGIEGNTKSVFNALDKMTDGVVKRSTPELALGIAGGGPMAGSYNRTINNNPQTSSVDNRNFTFNANANGTESNEREFYERLFKEFKWYIQQEGGAFD